MDYDNARDLDTVSGGGREAHEERGDVMDLDEELMLSESSTARSGSCSRQGSPMARKRRGRPPSTRTYAGLAKAKHLILDAEQLDEDQSRAEANAAARALAARAKTRARILSRLLSDEEDEDFQAAGSLSQIIKENVEVIKKVASTSKNLKGGYIKALKDAAEEIAKTAKVLHSRSVSEETKGLQAANARLLAEVAQLRKEVSEMRERFTAPVARPEPRIDSEDLVRTILCQVGTMVNARFEALEDRLLPERRIRPPLAADNRPEPVAQRAPVGPSPGTSGQASGSTPVSAPEKTVGKAPNKRSRTRAKTKAAEPQAQPQSLAAEQPQQSGELPWSEVVRRGARGGRKAGQTRVPANPNAQKKRAPRAPTVSEPKSAAVVVTITPEGFSNGLTYDSVIAEAKRKIRLQDIGITTGVRFRVCATGARRFEVMGSENGPQADALAQRLAQVFDGSLVRVSRPAKTVEIKVSGYDDSATVEEILAAVAEAGSCPRESLRCTGVIHDRFGVGHAWIECPVATAKKVVAAGRVTLSWVSASVKMMEPKPLRCYRCLQKGHVRAQCSSDIDRSNQCFRCGVDGHKFKECTADPHCTICAAAKRPAGHRLGGKGCSAPAPPRISRRVVASQPQPAQLAPAEVDMETEEVDNSANGS
ncbi:PREDICTED: uncharacterized protein LOC106123813 [Papilio xuthus]|uniref:Uncharacterized protein LOC106123813 n=1 Tax=Papilio xuthus TaxID=66420 RepID=A0AAJ7EFP1_PAPXU|nr:PREDICTED: uncharacterized protein LOC106123813 [Papilio xuthus]